MKYNKSTSKPKSYKMIQVVGYCVLGIVPLTIIVGIILKLLGFI